MRVSREITKERLLEVIAEVVEEGDEDMSIVTSEDLSRAIADAVWECMGELDDEDDLGMSKLREEDPEQGG